MALRKNSFKMTNSKDHLNYLLRLAQEQRLQWLTQCALQDYFTLINLEKFLNEATKETTQPNNPKLKQVKSDLELVFKTTYILNNNYSDLNPCERNQFLRACSLQHEIEIALTLLNRSKDLKKNLADITQDLAKLTPTCAEKMLAVVKLITHFSAHYSGQQLADFLQTLSIDPFTIEIFQDPVITPQGITFSKRTLNSWFEPEYGPFNPICPITKARLSAEDLLPNRLAKKLQQLPFTLDYAERVKEQLICPLTGLPFIEPVVAADGETYELRAIDAYLANNGHKTPQGIEQSQPLYPNMLIRDLLTIGLYNNQQYEILKRLNEYLTQVSKEPEPILGWIGVAYTKQQKIETVLKLIKVIMGKEPADPFLTEGRIRAILEQGRAADAAKPALNYLQQIRVR